MRFKTGIVVAMAVASMGGCATKPAAPGWSAGASRSPSLILSTPLMLETQFASHGSIQGGWEQFRNDDGREDAIVPIPDYQNRLYTQTRYRERLGISNGRPRENSSFRSWSFTGIDH